MVEQDNSFLFKRIEELGVTAGRQGRFTNFLNEADQNAALQYARKRDFNFLSFGGFESSERNVIGFFKNGIEPLNSLFPIKRIRAVFFKDCSLAHKDFLGTLISGGIKREAVGDIFVFEGCADIFVLSSVADYICDNISYVKGVSVKFSVLDDEFTPPKREYTEQSFTVKTPRLDAVVAHLSKLSREKAVEVIRQNKVILNYKAELDKTVYIKDGDRLTIRSVGKFIIDRASETTAKGRVKISVRKYR